MSRSGVYVSICFALSCLPDYLVGLLPSARKIKVVVCKMLYLFLFSLCSRILPYRKKILEHWFRMLNAIESPNYCWEKNKDKRVYESGSASFENHCIAFYRVYVNFNEVETC